MNNFAFTLILSLFASQALAADTGPVTVVDTGNSAGPAPTINTGNNTVTDAQISEVIEEIKALIISVSKVATNKAWPLARDHIQGRFSTFLARPNKVSALNWVSAIRDRLQNYPTYDTSSHLVDDLLREPPYVIGSQPQQPGNIGAPGLGDGADSGRSSTAVTFDSYMRENRKDDKKLSPIATAFDQVRPHLSGGTDQAPNAAGVSESSAEGPKPQADRAEEPR